MTVDDEALQDPAMQPSDLWNLPRVGLLGLGMVKQFLPALGRLYRGTTEMVPVAQLKEMRLGDRAQENPDRVAQIAQEIIASGGIREPLIVDYYQPTRKAILSEGNHRLAAAAQLGLTAVPARVMRYERTPFGLSRRARTVQGVEPDKYGYVPGDLRPSEIGLTGEAISPLRRRLLREITEP